MCDPVSVSALAIGRFDGFHLGHQALLARLREDAGLLVIDTGGANLTPPWMLERLTKRPVCVCPLEQVQALDGPGFVTYLQQRFPRLCALAVGHDFRFGRDRGWDAQALKALFCGRVAIVPEYRLGALAVRSSTIREAIIRGDLAQANAMLGRPYCVEGSVIVGQGIGEKHLVATLNLDAGPFVLPPQGVWGANAYVDDDPTPHRAAVFLGHRVSTDGRFALEVHLVDGPPPKGTRRVGVAWMFRLRENRRFDTLSALKEQIDEDIALIRHRVTGSLQTKR